MEHRFNSVNWNLFKASDMPIKLTNIRFNVQARPYDQKITGGATCGLAALNKDLLRLLPQDIINGTTGYLHSGYEVRLNHRSNLLCPYMGEYSLAYTGSLRHWI